MKIVYLDVSDFKWFFQDFKSSFSIFRTPAKRAAALICLLHWTFVFLLKTQFQVFYESQIQKVWTWKLYISMFTIFYDFSKILQTFLLFLEPPQRELLHQFCLLQNTPRKLLLCAVIAFRGVLFAKEPRCAQILLFGGSFLQKDPPIDSLTCGSGLTRPIWNGSATRRPVSFFFFFSFPFSFFSLVSLF
jgi:hypothetical protein